MYVYILHSLLTSVTGYCFEEFRRADGLVSDADGDYEGDYPTEVVLKTKKNREKFLYHGAQGRKC